MDNYWYYTLSAIPQTLAAMIALAATFVVFKLAIISERINETRKDLRRFILLVTSNLDKKTYETEIHEIEPLSNDKFLKLYEVGLANLKPKEDYLGLERGKFEKYEKEMLRIINEEWHSSYTPKDFRIFGYLATKKNILKSLLSLRQRSLVMLISSLTLVALTIIASVTALPKYDYFEGSILLVDIVVCFSVLSTVITGWSVWTIAKGD